MHYWFIFQAISLFSGATAFKRDLCLRPGVGGGGWVDWSWAKVCDPMIPGIFNLIPIVSSSIVMAINGSAGVTRFI